MTWRFWDRDGDGIKTADEVAFIIRMFVYISIPPFMIVVEGINPQFDVYTNIEIIGCIAASFGVMSFEMFLQSKMLDSNLKKKNKDEIITTEGEK